MVKRGTADCGGVCVAAMARVEVGCEVEARALPRDSNEGALPHAFAGGLCDLLDRPTIPLSIGPLLMLDVAVLSSLLVIPNAPDVNVFSREGRVLCVEHDLPPLDYSPIRLHFKYLGLPSFWYKVR